MLGYYFSVKFETYYMSIIYMVKCINIVTRIGSKQNDIKLFNHLLPTDVATVCEPFGGSFVVINYLY